MNYTDEQISALKKYVANESGCYGKACEKCSLYDKSLFVNGSSGCYLSYSISAKKLYGCDGKTLDFLLDPNERTIVMKTELKRIKLELLKEIMK